MLAAAKPAPPHVAVNESEAVAVGDSAVFRSGPVPQAANDQRRTEEEHAPAFHALPRNCSRWVTPFAAGTRSRHPHRCWTGARLAATRSGCALTRTSLPSNWKRDDDFIPR
jgi:hypothetical protein